MTTLSGAQLVRVALAAAVALVMTAQHLDAFIFEQWFPGFYYPAAY
jgi:hypothetical protein